MFNKIYIPYSILAISSLIELIMIIVILSNSSFSSISRLLLLSSSNHRSTIQIIFIVTLAFNYLTNFIYIFIFIRYIKPLILNPKQTDIISHGFILVIGTLTNYRFALLVYSKMFSKPSV